MHGELIITAANRRFKMWDLEGPVWEDGSVMLAEGDDSPVLDK